MEGKLLCSPLQLPGVNSQPGGGVGGLPEQPGGQPVVEGEEALLAHHPHEDGGGGGAGAAGALHHLHAVLDQVQRLHEAGGEHAEEEEDDNYFPEYSFFVWFFYLLQ